jgi:TrmH RNA methyltransferase
MNKHPARETPVEIVYGYRASVAVLETRLTQVITAYASRDLRAELSRQFSRLAVQWCDDRTLTELARTKNHEGLVLKTVPRRWTPIRELSEKLVKTGGVCVALDRVRNPYNIGAILRTAAFFGVDAVLLGSIAPDPALPEDAVRVAEGGAERTMLARTTDLAQSLATLVAAGVDCSGAESDGSVDWTEWKPKFAHVFVVGHEREGISPRVRAQCATWVSIGGSGSVASLNVAVAAGLVIGDLARQRARHLESRKIVSVNS